MTEFLLYLKLGLTHVLDWQAYDHVLFLIVLVAAYNFSNWKRIFILVSLFTIGHTTSLLLANYKVVAISSNDIENYPQDGPEQMQIHAKNSNYPFPYLYDETQSIAKAYDAACTPDFFLFDSELKLVYRGQLDDSRPGNTLSINGTDVLHAVQCMAENKVNMRPQKPSIGCNIKWKTN